MMCRILPTVLKKDVYRLGCVPPLCANCMYFRKPSEIYEISEPSECIFEPVKLLNLVE